MRHHAVLALVVLAAGCGATPEPREERVDPQALAVKARATLDDFHAAAAAADGARYFGLFAKDGVFLGTDATERWTVEQFRAYAKPHFDTGKGWTYEATERHVDVDAAGRYAWFDELLTNEKLGPCRGSGVLRNEGGAWKVVQYNLSIPIPNDLAYDVADQIKKVDRRTHGGTSFVRLTGYDGPERPLVRRVIEELERTGEKPGELWLSLPLAVETKGDEKVLALWHTERLDPKYERTRGDPTGKCRNAYVSQSTSKVRFLGGWE